MHILWLSVSKVVHNHIKGDDLIRIWQQRCLINWNQSGIIKLIEVGVCK